MDNHRPGSSWRPLIAALVAMLVAALALMCAPAPALARDYSIDAVDIDLTVNTDGSIRIVEEREFNFDGSFNGVYWDIATSAPAEASSDVGPWISDLSVEDLNQSWGAFSEAYSGDPGTYEVSDYYSFTRVKIYTPHEDERARVRISYTMNNVVNAWADTGELYWKFVSDGWDVPSDNVTCRVHLPVPAGATVSGGDNVRAWGHGPLDASLSFDGNDVVYTVPGVGTDEYAEARITFPVEWLTDMAPSSTSRLSTIRAEEQQWADEANARRERARATLLVGTSVGAASCVGIVALAALLTLRYRRRHRAQFDDDYFRDVPSDDHPAVLAALWAGGKVPSEAFTATLMKLTDDGIIGLSLVKDDKGRDKDYQIERGDRKAKNDIDSAAMNLLFNVVAPRGKDRRWRDAPAGGYKTLRFSDVKRAAKKAPQTYSEALDEWRDEVSGRCEVRNFFDEDGFTGRAPLLVFSILLACVGIVASVFLLGAARPEPGGVYRGLRPRHAPAPDVARGHRAASQARRAAQVAQGVHAAGRGRAARRGPMGPPAGHGCGPGRRRPCDRAAQGGRPRDSRGPVLLQLLLVRQLRPPGLAGERHHHELRERPPREHGRDGRVLEQLWRRRGRRLLRRWRRRRRWRWWRWRLLATCSVRRAFLVPCVSRTYESTAADSRMRARRPFAGAPGERRTPRRAGRRRSRLARAE